MFWGKGLDLYYAGLGQLFASPFSQMDQWFTVASRFLYGQNHVLSCTFASITCVFVSIRARVHWCVCACGCVSLCMCVWEDVRVR